MKIIAITITLLLITASTAFSVCQVWNLAYQYRPAGSMNNICVYKSSFQEIAVEANGQYCPGYIMYDTFTGTICN